MIAKNYTDRINDLISQSETDVSRLDNLSGGKWEKWKVDPELSILADFYKCFDRTECMQAYKAAHDTPSQGSGTTGKSTQDGNSGFAMSASIQNDILGSMQQGTLLRYRTRLQLMADAMSRRDAQANVVFKNIHLGCVKAFDNGAKV